MTEPKLLEDFVRHLDIFLQQMVEQQRTKTLKVARRIDPRMTEDDVMDPHSFPAISTNPAFAYEDGLLAGLVAAHVAVTREGVCAVREERDSG
ncbi:hypothetical protein KQI84_10665 [bacterium]|nr:hypothetical protein [bacterium]